MIRTTPCLRCRHLYLEADAHGYLYHCKAFPIKIPEEILQGDNPHIAVYPGDNGIIFELIDAEEYKRRFRDTK